MTAPATTPAQNPLTWPVCLAAVVVVAACVVLHYETIRGLVWALKTYRPSPRVSLVGVVLVLLLAHIMEIVLFAMTHATLKSVFGERVGKLIGNTDGSLTDALYFSAAVYTTVGFGDITPEGPIRLLVGIEALAGLVLITWSASFTFLVMERCFMATLRSKDNDPPAGR